MSVLKLSVSDLCSALIFTQLGFFALSWDGKRSLERQSESSAVQAGEVHSSPWPLFLLCMCPALDLSFFSLALASANKLLILSVISLFPRLGENNSV